MSLERRLRALETCLSPDIGDDGYCVRCRNQSMTLFSHLPVPDPCRRCGKLADSIMYLTGPGERVTEYPPALKGRCNFLMALPNNGRNPLSNLHGVTMSWLK